MKSIATSTLSPYLLTAAILASPTLALALTGGPDGGGYQFEDSDEPGGPAPNWIDIVGIGNDAAIGDGDSLVVPLPFTFTYYGVQYDEVTLDDDGVLLLGATSSISFSNDCLPYDNYTGDNAFIAALWDDLDPEGAGAVGVYYATLGQPGNLRFVVSFINVPHWNTTSFYDVQIVLFEGVDEIQLQYGSIDEVDPNYGLGASATVGIQGDSSTGLEVSCNGTSLTSDYAIRFWQDCTDLDGDGVTTCDGDCDDGDPAVYPGVVEICDGVDNDCAGGVDDGLRSYSATDSDAIDGPVFGWIDISATGTDAGLTDEGEANVAVPFPFEFYGSQVDELTVGANGAILMEGNQGLSFTNPCLPGDNTSGGDTLLAPLWDDLDPGDGAAGGVFHEVIGAAPDRQLVIQYQDIPRYSTQAMYTFQVILGEGSSDVLFQYLSLDALDPTYAMGASASVGIQASAAEGTSYACNDGSALHDQLAILFEDTSFIDLDGDGLSSCDGDCDDADGGQNGEDADGDGVSSCDGDCDDGDPAVYPGADEFCDGADNNCDGLTDQADPTYIADFDADGDDGDLCGGTDCDDADAAFDGLDDDGDGVSTCGPDATPNTTDDDCDDNDDANYPGNTEWCDLQDNDCDGDIDAADASFVLDLDGDGFDAADCGGSDCDDEFDSVFPEVASTSGWQRECETWLRSDLDDDAWYFATVEQPNLVFDGSRIAMYFRTGFDLFEMAFGVYYSDDLGQTWTLDGPVFQGTGDPLDWDGWGISNPNVLYDAGDPAYPYKLYFSARNPNIVPTTRSFGMAVSSDGLTWNRVTDINLDTEKILEMGGVGDMDEDNIGTPYVYISGTTYVMLYLCRTGTLAGICMATSVDSGYSWTKWDSAPGVDYDPEPLFLEGDPGEWDETTVSYPVAITDGTTDWVLHTGKGNGIRSSGVVHTPFAITGADKLSDISPAFEAATQATRWDYEDVYATDAVVDAGEFGYFYSGTYSDAAYNGGIVTWIGTATNTQPELTLDLPAADPHSMATTDPVTFEGGSNDSEALDTLYVVISSSADSSILLSTFADGAGDWSITAPGSTFPAGQQTVVITVYDEGGVAASTSIVLDVS